MRARGDPKSNPLSFPCVWTGWCDSHLVQEALNGIIVKKGADLGIPTSYNLALYALLSNLHPKA